MRVRVRWQGRLCVRGRCAGFTLVEVLCVAALVGVSAVGALAGFDAAARAARVRVAAGTLAWDLRSARAEAVMRGRRVTVCASADGVRCGGAWGQGWMVFDDGGGGGQPASGRDVLRARTAWRGVEVHADLPVRAAVSYTAGGWPRQAQGALQMGSFLLCAGPGMGRRVVLSASGRVRVESGFDPGVCAVSAG